jgi:hypothetical protein
MSPTRKRPLNEYVEAFASYAPWESKKFHTRPYGRHALVNDGTAIYQVSHFDDLLADYATFFSVDLGMVYVEFPAELWQIFLTEKITINSADFIIDLYKAWQQFWKSEAILFKKKDIYQSAKSESYQKFNQLVEKFNGDTDSLLETAIKIDDTEFLTVIAIAIKLQYPQASEFYRECVRLMTERFPDQVGDGEMLVKVGPEDQPNSENQTFFIYTVDEDF